MVVIIGAPFEGGGREEGSRLGPSALRLAGLEGVLRSQGLKVEDRGDLNVRVTKDANGIRNFESGFESYKALRSQVAKVMTSGKVPMVLGGDHSNSFGSISGALAAEGEKLAVIWIDAHADINTPATSPSGNLHGMPLAALMGQESGAKGATDRDWSHLLSDVVPDQRLKPNRIAWLGLRDVDMGEADAIAKLKGCFPATMQDIDQFGLVAVLQSFDGWMRSNGATSLWVSLDVDVFDPVLAPGTGTAVRGGLTYREGHLVAEMLRRFLSASDCPYRLAGLDVVETNPIRDTHNETAGVAVEWVASLFGKTILKSPLRMTW